MSPLAWVATIGLLVSGGGSLLWGIRGDPARGRRRCPRCWYDLGGSARELPLACSECGRKVRRERELSRTRRLRVHLVTGLLLVGAGLVIRPSLAFAQRGWLSLPAPIVFIAGKYFPPASGPGNPAGSLHTSLMVLAEGRLSLRTERLAVGCAERLLRSADPLRRVCGADLARALATGGHDTGRLRPAVTAAMLDPDVTVQEHAGIAILSVRPGDPQLLLLWERVLAGPGGPTVHPYAVRSMAQMLEHGHKEPLPILLKFHAQASGGRRDALAFALCQSRDIRVAGVLACDLYTSPQPSLLLLAIAGLEEAGAPAVPAILAIMQKGEMTYLSVKTLGALRSGAAAAMPALRYALIDPTLEARTEAIRAVGLIGDAPPDMVLMVRQGLMGTWDFKVPSMEALFRLGWTPDAEALDRLEKLATSDDPSKRMWARLFLSRMRCEQSACLPEILELLNSTDLWTRVTAIRALDALGLDAQSAAPDLQRLVSAQDGTSAARLLAEEARVALRRIRPGPGPRGKEEPPP